MALTKIDAIYLHTDIKYIPQISNEVDASGVERAVTVIVEEKDTDSAKAKAYLDSLGITYNWLNYADPNQHIDVFTPLNFWNFKDGTHTFNEFPFLIFTECDDELPLEQWHRVVFHGFENISNANISELYALGRSTYTKPV